MRVNHLDHLVMTVSDIDITVKFYTNILGFELDVFGDNRKALKFGNQKINLHQKGKEFEPKANHPTVGALDLCFIVEENVEQIIMELQQKGIEIVQGIVSRTGALGEIQSIYLRDPDDNLIELSNYAKNNAI
ncbi:MAG: VOC family protein [Flavobacteriaceae bacterium]|jgi:catechol 2,3-dioxygenase-like lactoylglutathione lyase family enzyme|nr:VOC family protein [Flavobacteriaceae bacterium]